MNTETLNPDSGARRGRRARRLTPEEEAELAGKTGGASVHSSSTSVVSDKESTGQLEVPRGRGPVALPGPDEPLPTLRKFGKRAKIIELIDPIEEPLEHIRIADKELHTGGFTWPPQDQKGGAGEQAGAADADAAKAGAADGAAHEVAKTAEADAQPTGDAVPTSEADAAAEVKPGEQAQPGADPQSSAPATPEAALGEKTADNAGADTVAKDSSGDAAAGDAPKDGVVTADRSDTARADGADTAELSKEEFEKRWQNNATPEDSRDNVWLTDGLDLGELSDALRNGGIPGDGDQPSGGAPRRDPAAPVAPRGGSSRAPSAPFGRGGTAPQHAHAGPATATAVLERPVDYDRDVDGVQLGELDANEAPDPRPAPRFEGKVLYHSNTSSGKRILWLVWVVVAIAVIGLVALLATGVLGPGISQAMSSVVSAPLESGTSANVTGTGITAVEGLTE